MAIIVKRDGMIGARAVRFRPGEIAGEPAHGEDLLIDEVAEEKHEIQIGAVLPPGEQVAVGVIMAGLEILARCKGELYVLGTVCCRGCA